MEKNLNEIFSTFDKITNGSKKEFRYFISEQSGNVQHVLGGTSFSWDPRYPTGQGNDWRYRRSWKLKSTQNAPVYAIEGGTVTSVEGENNPDNLKYGNSITIQGNKDNFFYTHLGEMNRSLIRGKTINKGDYIGKVGREGDVLIGLEKGDIKNYISNDGNFVTPQTNQQTETTPSDTTNNQPNDVTSNSSSSGDSFLFGLGNEIGSAIGLKDDVISTKILFDKILSQKKFLNEVTKPKLIYEKYTGDNSGIDELVYNPATRSGGIIGWGYDRGHRVNGITWSGHDTHLHVGFTNRQVAIEVIDKAHSLGLVTTENPYAKRDPNNRVDNVHTNSSFHYSTFKGSPKVGMGVDISGDQQKIIELIKWIDLKFIQTQNYPPSPNDRFDVDDSNQPELSQTSEPEDQDDFPETDGEGNEENYEDSFLYNLGREIGALIGLKQQKNPLKSGF